MVRGASAQPSRFLPSWRAEPQPISAPLRFLHREPPAVAVSVHDGIVHLLRVRRRPHERPRRRRARDVRDLERALPELPREPVDAVVADLLVLPRRPPPAVPAAVHPASPRRAVVVAVLLAR